MKRIYILDTTALLHYKRYQGRNVTVPGAIREIKKEDERVIINGLIEGGLIEILNAPKEYVEYAREKARETGDLIKLSAVDIEIIALSKFLTDQGKNVVVVTDDYSIQNVLNMIGIKYHYILRKIRKHIKWKLKCEKCGKIYPPTYKLKTCILCGGSLKRYGK